MDAPANEDWYIRKLEKTGAINWGFVAGKTNTIFAWDEVIPSGEEPEFVSLYKYTNYPDDMQFPCFVRHTSSRVVSCRSSFAAADTGQIGYTLPDEGRIRWYGHLRTDCPCLQHSAKFSYA